MEDMFIDKYNNAANKNNGLITKIWGSAGWIFNHSITFGYPLDPTPEQKNEYKKYFINLGSVLPCKYCRESYSNIISNGDTKLTDDALANRNTLTKWFYDVHEAVNKKLQIDYGVSYEDVVDRYEKYRAVCKNDKNSLGCFEPIYINPYKGIDIKDCPIVKLELLKPFITVAKLRGFSPIYFSFVDFALKLNGDFGEIKKFKTLWTERNKFCQYQIKKMREEMTPSVEESGEWEGTPTIDELKLLMFMSSNLNKLDIHKCLNVLLTKHVCN